MSTEKVVSIYNKDINNARGDDTVWHELNVAPHIAQLQNSQPEHWNNVELANLSFQSTMKFMF